MTASEIQLDQVTNIKVWLSDFVPYSSESWIGLLDFYNQSLWPYHLLAACLLLVLLWAYHQNGTIHRRIELVILALCWIWSGVVFHGQYYLTVNWSATIFMWLFLLQAALLLFWSLSGWIKADYSAERTGYISTVLLIVSMFSVPFLQLLDGHNYTAIGWPGVTPDATTVLSVFLVTHKIRVSIPLLLIPIVWSTFVFTTNWPMDYLPGMLLLPAVILVFILGRYCRRYSDSKRKETTQT